MIACIYKIRNLENGKIYIGSTKDFKKRKSIHLRHLKLQIHHNIYLQRSYNKNPYKFIFEIIERCDENILLIKEREWIDKLNPEYNIGSVGGGDNYTNNPNKKNIRKKLLKSLEKARLAPKPIITRDNNPNWKGGVTFFTCPVCKKETRIGGKKIKRKTCSDCYDKNGNNNPFYGKKHSEETKKLLSDQRIGKPNLACSKKCCLDGIEYISLMDASRKLNMLPETIRKRILSKSDKFKNWFYLT